MSVLKFELKETHLNLLKFLTWGEIEDGVITTKGETPFGGFNHYDDMSVILYGKPENFDPLVDEEHEWEESKINEMDELLHELPLAIEVVLNSRSFKPGLYKTKYHNRDWKLIKELN